MRRSRCVCAGDAVAECVCASDLDISALLGFRWRSVFDHVLLQTLPAFAPVMLLRHFVLREFQRQWDLHRDAAGPACDGSHRREWIVPFQCLYIDHDRPATSGQLHGERCRGQKKA